MYCQLPPNYSSVKVKTLEDIWSNLYSVLMPLLTLSLTNSIMLSISHSVNCICSKIFPYVDLTFSNRLNQNLNRPYWFGSAAGRHPAGQVKFLVGRCLGCRRQPINILSHINVPLLSFSLLPLSLKVNKIF